MFRKIVSSVESVVNESLEVGLASGLDHEPGLEGVDLSAALNRHVASVVVDVVKLVLLKKTKLKRSVYSISYKNVTSQILKKMLGLALFG